MNSVKFPDLGQHNKAILQGLLGMTDDEYALLVEGHLQVDYLQPDGTPSRRSF